MDNSVFFINQNYFIIGSALSFSTGFKIVAYLYLQNAQSFTALRPKEKAAVQSKRFEPAKAMSLSWVSVITRRLVRPRSQKFRRSQYVTSYDRHRTTEHIIFQHKLAKGFSSNIKGDGPMMSKVRYICSKRKHRRLNNSTTEEVRVSKRTLNDGPVPPFKLSRYAGQQLHLLKRDAPKSFDSSLTKRQKIPNLRIRHRSTTLNYLFTSGSSLFIKKKRKTIAHDTTEVPISKTPRFSENDFLLFVVNVFLTPVMDNSSNRKKSRKQQLKINFHESPFLNFIIKSQKRKKSKKEKLEEGIFPKTYD